MFFRSRFKYFTDKEICKLTLNRICRRNIQNDLQSRFYLAKLKGNLEDFSNKFIPNREQNNNTNNNIIINNNTNSFNNNINIYTITIDNVLEFTF